MPARRRRLLFALLGLSALSTLIVVALLSVTRLYSVPSGSMEPTLPRGARIVVTLATLWKDGLPALGELVTYEQEGTLRVKRVVGVPGDVVEFKDGHLVRNGAQVPTEAAGEQPCDPEETKPCRRFGEQLGEARYQILLWPEDSVTRRDDGPITVPRESVYVAGDNRYASSDSRHAGPVPKARLKGRVVLW